MAQERRFIGQYLLEKGIVTKEQLQEAVAEGKRMNRRLGDIIVERGFAKEEDVVKALSEQLGIVFIDITSYQFDPESISLISREAAEKLQAVPIYKLDNTLTVAMTDPLNVAAIDELEKITRCDINPVFTTFSAVKKVIERHYGTKERSEQKTSTGPVLVQQLRDEELPKLMEQAAQAPVVKLVNKIIADAVKVRASDIHLEPQEKIFYCRYRVDGMLQNPISLPREFQSAVISRVKIMSEIDIAEKRLPQDGRMQVSINGKGIDLRVATFPTIYGEHVAIRILDKSAGILKLDELGLAENLLEKFKSVIRKPHGIILVTGPTGSGKTTTLYSVLNLIKDSKKNIITLEDPVEYSIENIHQSQVNVKAGLTFASGLRSIVRLDPDVIMIGEIRDKETAEIAIHAALTGHLVLSTLHTNDAPGACARLIDIGVEPYLISSSLTAILAQRLVRKLCEKCKKIYNPTEEDLALIGLTNSDIRQGQVLFKEVGCEKCCQTGFLGRTGIYELLIPTDKIKELITKKVSAHELSEEAKKSGMISLLQDSLTKVKQGVTSISEVLRVTEEA